MTAPAPPRPPEIVGSARRVSVRWTQTVVAKALFVFVITLILLVPLAFVRSLVDERAHRSVSVASEVADIWGKQQRVSGPILDVPFRTPVVASNGTTRWKTSSARFLPEELVVEGFVRSERRYRGIFDVIVYEADLRCTGTFLMPSFEASQVAPEDLLWDRATLSVGLTDVRGISQAVSLEWGAETLAFEPGTEARRIVESGIHAALPGLSEGEAGDVLPFSYRLQLRGSRELRFLPLGKQTVVRLTSDWQHPSFSGAYLPSAREVSGEGFTAEWQVPYFARSYPQSWLGDESECELLPALAASAFGVDLFLPVDLYLMSTRSVKYGLLFVGLTFLSFFLVEILHPVRVHPFQYLMVGVALCLFYLLLLSLAEHIGFGAAYLLSSTATIVLVAVYCRSILRSWARATTVASVLAALYGFLWVLLRGEEHALLAGSLGLFAVLALVMFLTRRLDWYGLELSSDSK